MLCYKNVISALGCKVTKFFSFCQIIIENFEKRGIEQIERIDKIEQIEEIEQIDKIEQIDFIDFVFYLLYLIYLLYSLFFYLLKKLFFP